jgi:hypothetical protein
MQTKTKDRLITVYDERYGNMDDYTLKEIKEWLDFEAPSWCQEMHFNDKELCCTGYVGKGGYRKVVWKDLFGTWGFPTEIRG